MQIKKKIFTIVLLFDIFVIISMFLYLENIFIKTYIKLEEENVMRNLEKINNRFESKINELNKLVKDWSVWDDAYNFVKNPNEEFINSNLPNRTLEDLELNIVFVLRDDGEILFSKHYDLKNKKEILFPKDLVKMFNFNQHTNGFIEYDNKIFLITVDPIYDSEKRLNSNALFGMAYYVNENFLEKLSNELKVNLNLEKIEFNKDLVQKYNIEDSNEEFTKASISMKNIYGRNIFKINASFKRNIYKIGRTAINKFLIFLSIIFLIFSSLILVLMRKYIWKKIEDLNSQVNKISKVEEYKLNISGDDEIANLKNSINEMFKKIIKMTTEVNLKEEKFQLLYQEKDVIHIMFDENYIIKDMNKSTLKISGFSENELKGRSFFDFVQENDRERIKEFIDGIFLGFEIETIEIKMIGKNKIHYILIHSTNILLIEEKFNFTILMSAIDNTEKRKLEELLNETYKKI